MSIRNEQCNKVCRILDDVLANRPTERDSLIVAVRKAFEERNKGRWKGRGFGDYECTICWGIVSGKTRYCPHCGAIMEE